MARGDAIGDTVSNSHGGSLSMQPGSGVEWIIKLATGGNESSNIIIRLSDGTNLTNVIGSDQAEVVLMNFPVNNTDYGDVLNNTGGTAVSGFRGFITK